MDFLTKRSRQEGPDDPDQIPLSAARGRLGAASACPGSAAAAAAAVAAAAVDGIGVSDAVAGAAARRATVHDDHWKNGFVKKTLTKKIILREREF